MQVSNTLIKNLNYLTSTVAAPIRIVGGIVVWIKDYWNEWRLCEIAIAATKSLAGLEIQDLQAGKQSPLLRQAENLQPLLKSCRFKKTIEIAKVLHQHVIAHRYRCALLRKNDKNNEILYSKLAQKAQEWKNRHTYYRNKELSKDEEKKLRETTQYSEFAEFLVTDAKLLKQFFIWILPNDHPVLNYKPNDVEVFIKFPSLHQKTLRHLSARSMKQGGTLFKVNQHTQELNIFVEGSYYPVNNKKEKIVLRGPDSSGHIALDAFEIMSQTKAQYDIGATDVEVINETGFTNFNPHEFGTCILSNNIKRYNRPNFDDTDWMNKVPTVKKYSSEEVEKIFNISLDEYNQEFPNPLQQWRFCPPGYYPIFGIAATEKGPMEMDGTHGFYWFLIPDGKGKWDFKTMGEFVTPFVTGASIVFFLPFVHHSKICAFDQNLYYGWRSHTFRVIKPSMYNIKSWNSYTASLVGDVKIGLKGLLGFHMVNLNCTTRLSKKVIRHFGPQSIPNMEVDWWNLQPTGAVGAFFRTVKKITLLRNFIMTFLFFVCGAWKRSSVAHKHPEKHRNDKYYLGMFDKPLPWSKGKGIAHPHVLFIDQPKTVASNDMSYNKK